MGVRTHGAGDENEITNQLASKGYSHPLAGPELALGVSAKVARGVIRN